MPLPWTDKESKSLQPTRAFGATAPSERSLKKLRKVFHGKSHAKQRLTTYRAGVSTEVEAELRPLREAALQIIENIDIDAIKEASLEELAAAETMFALGTGFATLTDAVVLARGVADALAMRLRMKRFGLAAEPNWTVAVFLTTKPDGRRQTDRRFWLPLRHAICTASEEGYAAARKIALDAWKTLSIDQQANIAFVFPDEPWGEEVLMSPEALKPVRGSYAGMPAQVQQFGFLLSTCRRYDVAKACLNQGGSYWVSECALELARMLPQADAATFFMEALPPLLIKKKYQTFLKTPPRKVLAALMKLGDERVPAFVAGYVGHKVLGAQAATYFQECPEARAALLQGNASAQKLHESLLLGGGSDAKSASAEALPAILRERSWRPKKAKKHPRVAGLEILPSREEELRLPEGTKPPPEHPPLSGERLDAWLEDAATGSCGVDMVYVYSKTKKGSDVFTPPAEEALEAWNEGRGYVHSILPFLARHGLASLPGMTSLKRLGHLDYEGSDDWLMAYQSFDTPRMAPTWARIFSGRKKWKRAARRWLREDPRRAAEGLVPAALGGKGQAQKDAEAALRDLLRAGSSDALVAAAAAQGEKARASMQVFLERDPLVIDKKPPKLPPFLAIEGLPPLFVAGDEELQLSAEARTDFVELLSIAEPDYQGFSLLRDALEAKSLESFVLALLDTWARQGGPGRHEWMMNACLAFPTVTSTRALCQHARAWARSKGAAAQRACAGLAYLGAALESDTAALHLAHIAATTRFVALKKEVPQHLDDIARARGLTRDELDDRSTPDLGLDETGALRLAFGDTELEVRATEGLGVVLFKDGEVVRAFPRPSKSGGEEEKAAHKKAKAEYDAFKKDLASVAARQLRRLESSMAGGRVWTMADAKRYFFEHPLAQYLARGVVWLSSGGDEFRLTRDGTFASALDEEVKVEGDVRIAHVLELEEETAWSTLFGDYEIVQPILQLGRPRYALTAAEKKSASVTRFAGTKRRAAKVLGFLESRGWSRDASDHISAFERGDRDGGVIRLQLQGSIEVQYLSSGEDVALGALHPEGKISLVGMSEALLDLETLCA